MNKRLLEKDIKALLIKHLLDKSIIETHETLINEFCIDTHTRRIDLVVIKNHTTIGFEIKSEADSLIRINGQLDKYKNYFDKVIIVAAKKHISNLLKTVESNIEIWEIDNFAFKVVRRGKSVPIKNKENLLKILPLNFLIKIAHSNDLEVPKNSKNRKFLESLLSKLSVKKIRGELFSYLRKKYKNYSSEFMLQFGIQNNYSASALTLLSPYSESRLLIKSRNQKVFATLKKLTDEYDFKSDKYSLELSKTKHDRLYGDELI